MQSTELKQWREGKGLSQRDVAELLDVSGPTLNRWEKGEQDIPGPALKLLELLIHGTPPFGTEGAAASKVAASAWKVEMTLEAFEKLRAKAYAAGYDDLVDYIARLVLEDLAEEDADERRRASTAAPESGIALLADAPSTEPVSERQDVVYPAKGKKGAKK